MVAANPVVSVAGKTGAVTLAESDIANLTTDLAAKEVQANKDVASGYAGLDATGRVPLAQLPTAIQGPASYSGSANGTLAVSTGTVSSTIILQDWTLTGNTTANSFTPLAAGQIWIFIIRENSTGGFTWTWPSVVNSAAAINTSANAINVQTYVVGADLKLYPLGTTAFYSA